jgi:hypothetical protein
MLEASHDEALVLLKSASAVDLVLIAGAEFDAAPAAVCGPACLPVVYKGIHIRVP